MKDFWGSSCRWVGLSVVMAVALVTVPAELGQAQPDTFGAISWSKRTGVRGYAWGYNNRGAAENRALRECEATAGTGDCRVLLWFRNACGSIAETRDGAVGTGWGANPGLAEKYALQSCSQYGQCRVSRTFCSNQ
jgi:serine/threonine-protein kinase